MEEPQQQKPGRLDRETHEENVNMPGIGRPSPVEERSLRYSGILHSVADLLWGVQAALIALALGEFPELYSQQPDVNDYLWDQSLAFGIIAAAGVVVLAAVRAGLQRHSLNMSLTTAQSIQDRVRAQLLKSAASRSPVDAFPSSGAFAAHVTDQVAMLGPYYRNFTLQSMRVRLVPIAIVFVTAWISWLAALILLVSGPIIPVFMALIGTRAKAASADRQDELTRLGSILLDRVRGLETLRLFGALDRTGADIAKAGETFRKSTMQVLKIAFLSSTVLELFSALGIAFCAVYVGFSLLGDISIGTWGAPLSFAGGLYVLLLAPEFFAPMRAYATAYHDRAAGLAALEKLTALAKEIDRSGNKEAATNRSCNAGIGPDALTLPSIRFKDVSLSLGGQCVLTDCSLHIEPGETVLLSGPSGSGKTTLLDCILGFHSAQSGEVLVDDRPINLVAQTLRRQVMWLGQDPRLFHGSVKSNLLKGHPNTAAITEGELWTALEIAGADRLVRELPKGLSTQIGEDGFGLSQGEIRRIALARAAMRRGATLLLADEPTAGLDRETAIDVIRGLEILTNGRTAIIATHDPEVLKLLGRVVGLARSSSLSPVGEPA